MTDGAGAVVGVPTGVVTGFAPEVSLSSIVLIVLIWAPDLVT
jgi:hypothetical protein